MPQITLASLADTTAHPFSPTPEASPRPRAVPAARAANDRVATRSAALPSNELWALPPPSPIAERFCGALALSALLGVGSATLLAHGAATDSTLAVWFGVCGVFAAALIQLVERRRATILLTEAALERGLDSRAARRDARERLALWLS